MAEIKYSCMTKGITSDQFEFVGLSPKWATAQRNLLKIFDDHLECGSWNIKYSDIEAAALKGQRGLIFSGHILMIKTSDSVYQFGVNSNRYWASELPFPIKRL